MPRRYCGSCRSPLHADDGHSECVSCLGKSHADAALAGSDCSHCESISLASLCSRIAFFSESDPAPRTLPFSSSQGPVRKKQRGRGSQPKPGWMPNFSVSSQKRLKSWVWSGLHQRSPLAAVWMSGFCRGAVRPLSNDHRRSSLKFTTSSQDLALPYSARLRTSASSALTTIDGAEEKGYERMPQLDESVAAHLCPPTAIGWKAKANHPVQAMQDHFSARWTLLRFSWTGGFGAPLYGGSPGLSGQAPLCHR